MDRVLNVVYAVKRVVPAPVWAVGTAPYWWWYNRARHQAAAVFDHRLRRSSARLAAFHDRHRGERCFILGNGPSLGRTDLGRLRQAVTFGLNRIYLHFPAMGFATTYYVAVNTLVIEQCARDIGRLGMPRFVTWRGRQWIDRSDDVVFLDTDYTGPEVFSTDLSRRVFEGSTVTFVALELAYYMGFSEVILLGVDHSFSTQGRPNTTVVSPGEDSDHFSPLYFGRGFRWQLPDLEASERGYRLARAAFEEDGRRVLDATLGGKLTVFPKVDYESLFQDRG
jgi:hypothetical protein